MATNNYYNFTHTGTQYGAQYQASASTDYSQAAAVEQPYQIISGYTRPAANPAAATTHSQAAYYSQPVQQQQQQYAPPPMTISATGTSTSYPVYSANTAGPTANYGFSAPTANTANKSKKTNNFTNYDAAVYNSTLHYANYGKRAPGVGYKHGGGGGGNKMKGSRAMHKPQSIHYCDVCKISCAGPQTYKEHVDGQKHKKKEQAMKIASKQGGLRCELCDVVCSGADAYAAHIRGNKHQKVLKLHTKLGKPIPTDSPSTSTSTSANNNGVNNKTNTTGTTPPSTATPSSSAIKGFVKPTPPKINFLGPKPDFDRYNKTEATQPQKQQQQPPPSTTTSTEMPPPPPPPPPSRAVTVTAAKVKVDNSTSNPPENMKTLKTAEGGIYMEKEIQPVGSDYLEEIRGEDGKLSAFNCKLCECKFNDPGAKEMHMKGRRHRLQYKKKVNPDLVVDVKPSSRQKKNEDRRSARRAERRQSTKPEPLMSLPRGPPIIGGPPRFRGPAYGGGPNPPFFMPPMLRRETVEDRHIMAKHQEIYPSEEELIAIQKVVSNSEKALKLVSDFFAEIDYSKTTGKEEVKEADLQQYRILKGVMRVGYLAKGLLLRGDREVELIVLCSKKPTETLLNRVIERLPKEFEKLAPEEKYEIEMRVKDSGLVIKSTDEPQIIVKIILTSPLFRAETAAEENIDSLELDSSDLLIKDHCLAGLASLRRSKFFQARATPLQSCVIIIRILRDFQKRIPAFQNFPCWAIELLVEKAINTAVTTTGIQISPGHALRIVFEVLSSGIILPGGPGLLDPCEKESIDAMQNVSIQAREDITAFAQYALRKLNFKKIHEILGMDKLTRKRRRTEEVPQEQQKIKEEEKLVEVKEEKKIKVEVEENINSEKA